MMKKKITETGYRWKRHEQFINLHIWFDSKQLVICTQLCRFLSYSLCYCSAIVYASMCMCILCRNGHALCVEALFNHSRSEINDDDVDGRTPMLLACLNGHYACVKVLLRYNLFYEFSVYTLVSLFRRIEPNQLRQSKWFRSCFLNSI